MAQLTYPSCPFPAPRKHPSFDILRPLRRWIDCIEVRNCQRAHLICRVIPSSCPFEQDIALFGYTIHIPALCRLNPVYNEIVNLRLRALSYLTDICSEDTTPYTR